ncbi:MAG: TrmH family RNA methyltransferase [Pirellulaceae bacterium]
MPDFVHQRHKPASALRRPRELVLAFTGLRSRVNLSRIVRLASCAGISRLVTSGSIRVDKNISRGGEEELELETHRTLLPTLKKFKQQEIPLVGLEQAKGSVSLYDFPFPQQCVLVIGHEREGLEGELLQLMDQVVEIPVYGLPMSYNVATATAMAVYEYCRQYPAG